MTPEVDVGEFRIDMVPEMSDSFKRLRLQCLEFDIQERARQGWSRLYKNITIGYRHERVAMSVALGRAEWLARG